MGAYNCSSRTLWGCKLDLPEFLLGCYWAARATTIFQKKMLENELILLAIIKINIEPLLMTTTNLSNITIDTELKVTSKTIPSKNI